jgi:hypothetical protein
MKLTASIGLLLLAAALPALAQDETSVLDTIEVTGSRISYEDLMGTPAVSIRKPGDYLVQSFTLENDTRESADRERELQETIARIVAAGAGKYTVLHGDAYRVTLGRDSKVTFEPISNRADASRVTLQLRSELGAPAQAEALAMAMQQFLRETTPVGRTEIKVIGESALGMGRPERFRYELIAAISADTQKVMESLGLQCSVELDGLNSRIEWERVSAGELLMFIRYSLTFQGCSATRP